ncbi:hypothetical protein NDU88_002109 [Pleurodeles waltl]|uniref:Secreted protein n=1 Tax=Pleurodeles waltl TaxID=8319 RepID=A0AAV7MLR5_PLEWA|nr:hypothetical protein NDU88_002109 [Pleurodeles waltl]
MGALLAWMTLLTSEGACKVSHLVSRAVPGWLIIRCEKSGEARQGKVNVNRCSNPVLSAWAHSEVDRYLPLTGALYIIDTALGSKEVGLQGRADSAVFRLDLFSCSPALSRFPVDAAGVSIARPSSQRWAAAVGSRAALWRRE